MTNPGADDPQMQGGDSGESGKTIATSAARAGMWVGISVVATQLAMLVNSVIMARVLTPAEFGVVEICITIALFVNILGENGLSAEIVQQPTLSPLYLSTAYWANIVVGVVLTVAGVAATLVWGSTSGSAESQWMLALTFMNFAANGAGIVQRVLLVRVLNFARLAYVEIAGIVAFVLLSTVFALLGAGPAAYVAGWLIRTLLISVLLFFSVDWRPTWAFGGREFRSMAAFGANVFAGRVLVYGNTNIDRFIIWQALGNEVVGLYSLGRRVPTGIASMLYSIVLRVTFPLMARQQTNPQRLIQMYLKTVSLLGMVVIAPMLLLSVLAEPFVLVIFGQQWAPAILATRLIALTPLFVLVTLPSDSAFQAVGRPDYIWKNYAVRILLFVVFLGAGVWYGLDVIAVVFLLHAIVAAFVTHAFVQHLLGITWWDLLRAIEDPLRNSIGAALAALLILWVGQGWGMPEALILVLAGGAGALTYVLLYRVLNANELAAIFDLVGEAINRPVIGARLRALFQL